MRVEFSEYCSEPLYQLHTNVKENDKKPNNHDPARCICCEDIVCHERHQRGGVVRGIWRQSGTERHVAVDGKESCDQRDHHRQVDSDDI